MFEVTPEETCDTTLLNFESKSLKISVKSPGPFSSTLSAKVFKKKFHLIELPS